MRNREVILRIIAQEKKKKKESKKNQLEIVETEELVEKANEIEDSQPLVIEENSAEKVEIQKKKPSFKKKVKDEINS